MVEKYSTSNRKLPSIDSLLILINRRKKIMKLVINIKFYRKKTQSALVVCY